MDHINWYYKFLADVPWLNDFMASIERTDRALVLALTGETGVASGFDVTQKGGGQNFSVDISAGTGYDPSGVRFFSATTQNLPFVEDEFGDPIQVVGIGKARTVAIYAHSVLVDKPGTETIDGFGLLVFTVQEELVEFHLYQGAEANIGDEVPPADPGNDMVLLAYVQIRQGDLTVANADIDNTVKQYLSLTIGPNIVNEENINWGLGVGQVSAEDVPIEDAGAYFTATDVEAALQEIGAKALAVAVPIGSIIAHYDFNGLIAIDAAYWEYCRGQVLVDVLSPLNGQTIPDASGRYLVGFGTDGGANLHNAAWSAAAVGNAGHTVNLQHQHTVAAHNHTGPSHSHGPGSLIFKTAWRNDIGGDNYLEMYDAAGVLQIVVDASYQRNTDAPTVDTAQIPDGFGTDFFYTAEGAGTTASGGTGNTGNASPLTDNQLSTVQSIQPRSLRVRHIMRKR